MKDFFAAIFLFFLLGAIIVGGIISAANAIERSQNQTLQKEYEASDKDYRVFTCVKEYTTDQQYSKHSSYTRYFACFQSEDGEYQTFEMVDIKLTNKKPANIFAGIFVGKVYDVQTMKSSLYEYPIILDIREHK